MTVADLPALNAGLNGLATVLLAVGFICIRTGRKEAHRRCMMAAFVTSTVFLIGYVTHKILVRGVHTRLGAEGTVLRLYYLMLFTHVVLAAGIVPMAVLTIRRARRGDFESHRRLARWTWPLWMYVSVTGVLIYFMLYHWFPGTR